MCTVAGGPVHADSGWRACTCGQWMEGLYMRTVAGGPVHADNGLGGGIVCVCVCV